MSILIIDGLNFIHRARAGFQLGPAPVVFNFFRNLRALIEKFEPTRVYFVLEGHPRARHALLPEYKANRDVDPADEKKVAETREFFRQSNIITDMLQRRFPFSVVRHPDHECDDTIANLIWNSSTAIDYVIASSDSDFTQLAHLPNVRLYNPMKKEFVEPPDYDYVTWKALRGDPTDNVPGIPGVGDAKAANLASNPTLLREFLAHPGNSESFTRNYELISFVRWSDEEAMAMTCSQPIRDWDDVKSQFQGYGFKSITKDEYWSKFVGTFDTLFVSHNI